MTERPEPAPLPHEPEGLFAQPRSFTPAQLERAELEALPAIVVADGPPAMRCFVGFFAARIRNPNTRRNPARQLDWQGVLMKAIEQLTDRV
jgi:hypothetical protein